MNVAIDAEGTGIEKSKPLRFRRKAFGVSAVRNSRC
ncbi:hypothetical protein ES707_08014 [subsurface metagenome]